MIYYDANKLTFRGRDGGGPTEVEVLGKLHATGDICTDAGGVKCLSTAGGGAVISQGT